MKTYECTFWVLSKRRATVEAESEDAALDLCADGAVVETEIVTEYYDDREAKAREVVPRG